MEDITPETPSESTEQLWCPPCLDTSNYVVQSNDLIQACQTLSINAAKIVRIAIMQIKPTDKYIKGYLITIPELAEMLGVTQQNLYLTIDDVTDEITTSRIAIRKGMKFDKIPWAGLCKYVPNKGLFIRLNQELFPYVIGLSQFYTQYTFNEIVKTKSIYSLRVFELIILKLTGGTVPKEGAYVDVYIDEIFVMCNVKEGQYKKLCDIKESIMDVTVRDINRFTILDASYTDIKRGKKTVGFRVMLTRNLAKVLQISREERQKKAKLLSGTAQTN